MKINLKIRRPRKSDILQIHELFEKSIINTFEKEEIIDELDEESNSIIKTLENRLKIFFESNGIDEYFLIAFNGDKILGTISYGTPNKRIHENINVENSKVPEIRSVYILPGFQKKGIGSLLLQELIVELNKKGFNSFYLECGFKKAQYYWKNKLGDPICHLKDYWGIKEDHMIWFCENDKVLSNEINK